jgi:hypothetical protein
MTGLHNTYRQRLGYFKTSLLKAGAKFYNVAQNASEYHNVGMRYTFKRITYLWVLVHHRSTNQLGVALIKHFQQ